MSTKVTVVNKLTNDIRARVAKRVKLFALGNTHRTMKDVAQDLINDSGMSHESIADGCFLNKNTIKNLATGKTKRPQEETVSRVLRFFNMKVDLSLEKSIHPRFQNQEKTK